jgi:formate dehydrogenase iron-sulfur subunit
MPKSVLVDLTRCIGCRGCQMACKSWNERGVKKTVMAGDFTNPPELNSECYTNIRFVETKQGESPVWNFAKSQCLHCHDPACVAVCPVAALRKTAEGPVTYEAERCMGCRYCMLACPFLIPKYEWEKLLPVVQKCTFCSERIKDGVVPACIKTCPTGTMVYGEREEILSLAKARVENGKGKYVPHIYGEKEAGGTSWIYISAVPFEDLGFRTQVPLHALPPLTWNYINKIPFVMGGVVVLGVASWYTTRRKDVQEKEERR